MPTVRSYTKDKIDALLAALDDKFQIKGNYAPENHNHEAKNLVDFQTDVDARVLAGQKIGYRFWNKATQTWSAQPSNIPAYPAGQVISYSLDDAAATAPTNPRPYEIWRKYTVPA